MNCMWKLFNFHVFKFKILHISKSGYGPYFLLDTDINIIDMLCNFVKTLILFSCFLTSVLQYNYFTMVC